jgi:signal transduction histidine kinase
LKLFSKLLLPFLLLILVIGVSGAFFLVRGLASRAQADLKVDARRLLGDGNSLILIDQQYLRDSAFIAANLEDMAASLERRDASRVAELSGSVRVLRVNLNLIVIADRNGRGVVEIEGDDITKGAPHRGTSWSQIPFVSRTLSGGQPEDRATGFLIVNGRRVLAVAQSIRKEKGAPVGGVAIAGIRLDGIAEGLAGRLGAGVRIFDDGGRLLASGGETPSTGAPSGVGSKPLLLEEKAGSKRLYSAYTRMDFEGSPVGTLSVSVPVGNAFSSARDVALRLAITLLAAMAAIVGIGALLSRFILAQVKPLVDTNRALARGELSARATVVSGDELGELAQGFNDMAEKLEESHRDLERKIDERTRQLAEANRELKGTYQAQSEFFSQLSHELRSPLFVINGNAEMLLDPSFKRMSTRDRDEIASSIKKAGDYVLDLVNEILDFKRLEAGRMQIEVRDVALEDVLDDVVKNARSLARLASLSLHIEAESPLPHVEADPAHLKKVLNNLLSNAIKYTPAGGTVAITAVESGGNMEISISDTGVGIPKEHGQQIFEPFYRVKDTSPQRGEPTSGLGLALTKRLVEAQGGSIWYRSQAGKGSTFTFTLRIVRRPSRSSSRRRPARASR